MSYLKVACCLVLGLACPIGPVLACEGPACGDAPGKPLQLMRFMSAARTKPLPPAPRKHAQKRRPTVVAHRRVTVVAHQRKTAIVQQREPVPLPMTRPMLPEAALAYAAHTEPDPPVQVVPQHEPSPIDRTAGPLPIEAPAALRPAGGVQIVDATEYNDIDRLSDRLPPASFAERLQEAPAGDARPNSPPAAQIPSLGERLWAALQHVLAALGAGWRYLFG